MSLQTPLQTPTYAPFLTEEGLSLAKSTVEAMIRSENPHAAPESSASAPSVAVTRKVAEVFNLMASGIDVEIVPVKDELTVAEAGNFLRMSDNHVNDLLDAGEFAFRMNGSERMILRDSLLEFERKREETNVFLNELLEMDPDDD